jgi:formate hydrogenlyase transcriptional activator
METVPSSFEYEELKLLKVLDEGTASSTGERFFADLVRNLALVLGTKGAWVTELDRAAHRLRALSFWMDGSYIEGYEYAVKGTPCEAVIEEKRFHHIGENVVELYPDDPDLKPFNAVSYLGAPLVDSEGQVMGNLAILDDKPLPSRERILSIFRIFSSRAAAELQRIRNEQAILSLRSETTYLREEVFDVRSQKRILGNSVAIRRVLQLAGQVAPTDATVLITGETGTGKELLALSIHEQSRRNDHPYVKMNCATIPANLLESELFGHVKGAFTGATAAREGRFKVADKGTLFLDEIGELPVDLQAKLLRVLQEGEFEPVGSSQTLKTNVRIIAATNRNLLKMISDGTFREDLYYRLNIFPIHMPPLRERGEDVIQLARSFVESFSKQYNKPLAHFEDEDLRPLAGCHWPGNIRELRNLVERAVINAQGGRLDVQELVRGTSTGRSGTPPYSAVPNIADVGPYPPQVLSAQELKEIEKRNLIRALELCDGRVSGSGGAAALIGIPPTTFASRLKALGLAQKD